VFAIAGGALFVLLVAAVTGWFALVRPFDDEVRVTLVGTFPDGSPVTAEALDQAAEVLASRFEAADLADDPRVRVDGDRLVATFRSEVDQAQVEALIGPGELRFRKVIESTDGTAECGAIDDRLAGSAPADQPDTACDEQGYRYELAPAALTETDVASAAADLPPGTARWQVTLEFTAAGQDTWTALTREASTNADGECRTTGDEGKCLVAIVLDNRVLLAPQIVDVINGPAVIAGDFSREDAHLLAAQLAHGSQPLVLEVESVNS
jgi:preprotein translocase subunit SecD